MSSKPIMEFKRGTEAAYVVQLPIADYVVGSSLWFTAKPQVDNDVTDSLAVIEKQFGDADVSLSADPLYATYTCEFEASDLAALTFPSGQDELDYIGEFSYVVPGEDPVALPYDNRYIQVKIYGNLKLS